MFVAILLCFFMLLSSVLVNSIIVLPEQQTQLISRHWLKLKPPQLKPQLARNPFLVQNYSFRTITQIQARLNTSQQLEAVLALDLVELQGNQSVASSDELQVLRGHIGLGVGGMKEMNKAFILKHVNNRNI